MRRRGRDASTRKVKIDLINSPLLIALDRGLGLVCNFCIPPKLHHANYRAYSMVGYYPNLLFMWYDIADILMWTIG